MLVCTRRWKALGGLAAGGLLFVALTGAVAGWSLLGDYLAVGRRFSRLYMQNTDVLRVWKYVDLRSAALLLTGKPGVALAFLLVATCAVAPFLILFWRCDRRAVADDRRLAWATAIIWTLLLNVYVPFYDCTLLVLGMLLLTQALGGASLLRRDPLLQWLVLLMYVGAWFTQAIAQVSGLQLYTVLLLTLGVYSMTRQLGAVSRPGRVVGPAEQSRSEA